MFSFARYVVHSFGLLFFSLKKRTTFATLAFALSSHSRRLLSFHFFSFKISPQLHSLVSWCRTSLSLLLQTVILWSCLAIVSLPPASSLVSCLTWPATRILMSIFMLDRQHSGPKDHLVLTAAGITSRRWMGVFSSLSLWLTFSRLFLRFMLLSCVHIWLLFCETQGN